MKTREEKIAELSEGDRLALEYYEAHEKTQPIAYRFMPEHARKIYDHGKKIAESLEPKVWEPKGGDYFVDSAGRIFERVSSDEFRLVGVEAENEEEAQRKADLRIAREIINDLICEKNKETDFVADWKNKYQHKYAIYFDHISKQYKYFYTIHGENIGTEYCSLKSAKEICEMLNNGLVRGVGR